MSSTFAFTTLSDQALGLALLVVVTWIVLMLCTLYTTFRPVHQHPKRKSRPDTTVSDALSPEEERGIAKRTAALVQVGLAPFLADLQKQIVHVAKDATENKWQPYDECTILTEIERIATRTSTEVTRITADVDRTMSDISRDLGYRLQRASSDLYRRQSEFWEGKKGFGYKMFGKIKRIEEDFAVRLDKAHLQQQELKCMIGDLAHTIHIMRSSTYNVHEPTSPNSLVTTSPITTAPITAPPRSATSVVFTVHDEPSFTSSTPDVAPAVVSPAGTASDNIADIDDTDQTNRDITNRAECLESSDCEVSSVEEPAEYDAALRLPQEFEDEGQSNEEAKKDDDDTLPEPSQALHTAKEKKAVTTDGATTDQTDENISQEVDGHESFYSEDSFDGRSAEYNAGEVTPSHFKESEETGKEEQSDEDVTGDYNSLYDSSHPSSEEVEAITTNFAATDLTNDSPTEEDDGHESQHTESSSDERSTESEAAQVLTGGHGDYEGSEDEEDSNVEPDVKVEVDTLPESRQALHTPEEVDPSSGCLGHSFSPSTTPAPKPAVLVPSSAESISAQNKIADSSPNEQRSVRKQTVPEIAPFVEPSTGEASPSGPRSQQDVTASPVVDNASGALSLPSPPENLTVCGEESAGEIESPALHPPPEANTSAIVVTHAADDIRVSGTVEVTEPGFPDSQMHDDSEIDDLEKELLNALYGDEKYPDSEMDDALDEEVGTADSEMHDVSPIETGTLDSEMEDAIVTDDVGITDTEMGDAIVTNVEAPDIDMYDVAPGEANTPDIRMEDFRNQYAATPQSRGSWIPSPSTPLIFGPQPLGGSSFGASIHTNSIIAKHLADTADDRVVRFASVLNGGTPDLSDDAMDFEGAKDSTRSPGQSDDEGKEAVPNDTVMGGTSAQFLPQRIIRSPWLTPLPQQNPFSSKTRAVPSAPPPRDEPFTRIYGSGPPYSYAPPDIGFSSAPAAAPNASPAFNRMAASTLYPPRAPQVGSNSPTSPAYNPTAVRNFGLLGGPQVGSNSPTSPAYNPVASRNYSLLRGPQAISSSLTSPAYNPMAGRDLGPPGVGLPGSPQLGTGSSSAAPQASPLYNPFAVRNFGLPPGSRAGMSSSTAAPQASPQSNPMAGTRGFPGAPQIGSMDPTYTPATPQVVPIPGLHELNKPR